MKRFSPHWSLDWSDITWEWTVDKPLCPAVRRTPVTLFPASQGASQTLGTTTSPAVVQDLPAWGVSAVINWKSASGASSNAREINRDAFPG